MNAKKIVILFAVILSFATVVLIIGTSNNEEALNKNSPLESVGICAFGRY